MKKLFTLLTTCLLWTAAWAATVTIDLTTQGYTNAQEVTQVSENGVTLLFDKGSNSNTPKWYDSGSAVRLYGGGTLTVSAGATITKIEFTLAANNGELNDKLSASTGTYASPVWTGSATSVVFTQGGTSGHIRFQKVAVTYEGEIQETVSAPTFTPPAGTYYNTINVEIKCSTEGANIYYTTNGSTPTASSTAYSAPIAISENTTLKAIAIKGDKQSEVAEAAYAFESATAVANIATYQDAADGMVTFTSPVRVLAQNGNNLYVMDNTGYALIYGDTGKKYKNGNSIPAGFTGLKKIFNGEPELTTPLSGFQDGLTGDEIPAEEIQCEDVGADLFAHYVLIKGAKLNVQEKTITDASGTAPIYTGMGGYGPSTDDSKTYDVYAIIGSYRPQSATETVYQVLPVKLVEVVDPQEVPTVADVNALYDLEKGKYARITSDVVAIYQNGPSLYVKNGDTFTLVYGTLTNQFTNGDIIRGAVAAWSEYQGIKQLTPLDETFTVAEHGTAVEPIEMPLEEMGQEMVHTYFIVKNATITESEGNLNINDGTIDMLLFNKFSIDMPQSLEGNFDVKCFLTVYNGELELYPIEISKVGGEDTVPGDVTGDGTVDIADVNAAINVMLGKEPASKYEGRADLTGDGNVDIADVNAVINKMLGK